MKAVDKQGSYVDCFLIVYKIISIFELCVDKKNVFSIILI